MEIGKTTNFRILLDGFYLTAILLLVRPDGVGSITHEEKEKFQEIKERLRVLLENQITNFR